MTTQRVIDSDTHVDETNATWEYMTVEEAEHKPTIRFEPSPEPGSPGRPYWLVDGLRQRRPDRNDMTSRTTAETRELIDVEARLRHMDELGTDVQVIYPTLFITDPAPRPEVELSITRSYNRWLADRCAEARGRLRWICVPPLKNMEAALEELRFAKDHGACGVLKKGDGEAGHWPSDPYFFPLYEEAERLDMPICFHTGTGGGGVHRRYELLQSEGAGDQRSVVAAGAQRAGQVSKAAFGLHRSWGCMGADDGACAQTGRAAFRPVEQRRAAQSL